MSKYKEYLSDVNYCREIQKKHGKSYFFATRLFPKDIQRATHILYAFFRTPDEIVDNPENSQTVKQELLDWKSNWESAKKETSINPVLRATANLFKEYQIPNSYADAFIASMIQDIEKSRYKNYQDLENYMYGSAATVGLMMTYVIGFTDKKALEYAEKLGYAMQLTNILRDIDEDYIKRNRIYLPQDELAKFYLTEEDISKQNKNENFNEFIKWQIARARRLYRESDEGIKYLSPRGQFAVKLGSALYEAILSKIEQANYNIFNNRVKTSLVEKCLITLKTSRK